MLAFYSVRAAHRGRLFFDRSVESFHSDFPDSLSCRPVGLLLSKALASAVRSRVRVSLHAFRPSFLLVCALLITGCSEVHAPGVAPDHSSAHLSYPVEQLALPSWKVLVQGLFLNSKIKLDAAEGESLILDSFQPSGYSPWQFAIPINYAGIDPFSSANWRFNLNALRVIDPLLAPLRT